VPVADRFTPHLIVAAEYGGPMRPLPTLTAAMARLRAGTTSEALTEQLLAALDEHSHLGAFTTLDHDAALESARRADREPARGPLHGIPIVVKDNIHVAGMPNSAATPALQDFVPDTNAPAVQRLVEAGAFVMGKTNMHELALGITSSSSVFGPVRNARDHTRFAGGSSGGTAVAVACGAPAGLGTDTGGSVRIPAALNGVCGLRPTPGRIPTHGVTPLSATRDTVGPIANTVDDLAILDAVLAGDHSDIEEPPAHHIRLGIPGGLFTESLEPGTAEAFGQAIERLRSAGVTVIDVPATDFDALDDNVSFTIVRYEANRDLTRYLAEFRPSLSLTELAARIVSADVHGMFHDSIIDSAPNRVLEEAYREAVGNGRAEYRAAYADLFAAHSLNALVFPTTPRRAGPVGATFVEFNGVEVPAFGLFIRNTGPGTVAGVPGLTVPIPVAGLPVGLALDGPRESDRDLLALGIQVQRLLTADTA
jgi:indoleacetamide hydrolase